MPKHLIWVCGEERPGDWQADHPLVWVRDPDILAQVAEGPENFTLYLDEKTSRIAHRGYSFASERAAAMILINLISGYVGKPPEHFLNCLQILFEAAGDYLFSGQDLVSPLAIVMTPVEQIIRCMMLRALVEDAIHQLPPDLWIEKVSLYSSLCRFNRGTRNIIWCEDWLEDIGGPGHLPIVDTPDYSLVQATKPDFVAFLCLYDRLAYAERLVDVGYRLEEYILYVFQPSFWRGSAHETLNLTPVASLCKRAINLRTKERRKVAQNHQYSSFDRGGQWLETLRLLVQRNKENYLGEKEQEAVSLALKYFKRADDPLIESHN